MSEPLTEVELDVLTQQGPRKCGTTLRRKAVAEIHDLRKSVKNLVEATPAAFNIIEADNAKLREKFNGQITTNGELGYEIALLRDYVTHRWSCQKAREPNRRLCTCGLDAVLAGKDDDG